MHIEELGRRAADLLIRHLEGEAPTRDTEIIVPVSLTMRESCGGKAISM